MAEVTAQEREAAFGRVMAAIDSTRPDSKASFTAQCQAYGSCQHDMNDAKAENLLTFLHETYGMEIAMTILVDLLKLQNCKEKVDALRAAKPRGLTNAAAAAAAATPAAPAAAAGSEGSDAAIQAALERDRKLREEFGKSEGDTVENLKNFNYLEVWYGENGHKNKEALTLCAEYLSNTTHKVLYNSWIVKMKDGLLGNMVDRVIAVSSAAYYRMTFHDTQLKVVDYIRMPLNSIDSVTQPTTITIQVKTTKEDGDSKLTSIFKSGSGKNFTEKLYCPATLSTSRVDKPAVADEVATTFKRAIEIFKENQ